MQTALHKDVLKARMYDVYTIRYDATYVCFDILNIY